MIEHASGVQAQVTCEVAPLDANRFEGDRARRLPKQQVVERVTPRADGA